MRCSKKTGRFFLGQSGQSASIVGPQESRQNGGYTVGMCMSTVLDVMRMQRPRWVDWHIRGDGRKLITRACRAGHRRGAIPIVHVGNGDFSRGEKQRQACEQRDSALQEACPTSPYFRHQRCHITPEQWFAGSRATEDANGPTVSVQASPASDAPTCVGSVPDRESGLLSLLRFPAGSRWNSLNGWTSHWTALLVRAANGRSHAQAHASCGWK